MRLQRWFVLGVLGALVLPVAARIRPYVAVMVHAHPPDRILVLGGDVDRERAGLLLARQLKMPLVVSGGSNPEYARWLVQREGLPAGQVQLDYRATDTLGNFTSLVDDLHRQGVRHVLLVTSEDHLPRALTVGTLVAGSRGIRLTGVPVACGTPCAPENAGKHWGDGLRAFAWVLTGQDLKPWAKTQLERLVRRP